MHVRPLARRVTALATAFAALALAAGAALALRGCGPVMSVAFDVRVELDARLASFPEAVRAGLPGLLDAVGAEVESQTKRRIADEKTAPDGTPWKSWSDAYKATRHGGHSLLRAEDHLMTGIQYIVEDEEVFVGSKHPGAAHLFFGSKPEWPWNLPPRQALGLSPENLADLDAEIGDWLEELLA